jgi:hypothetical protein
MGECTLRARRSIRRIVAISALAVVLVPAFTEHDSFPISNYPMYAFTRGRTDRFQLVLGQTSSGTSYPLSLRVVADTDDPLIAESLVADAIRRGAADSLCRQIAQRVSDETVRVLVAEEDHDVIRQARREPSLTNRVVYAACERPP